MLLRSRPSVAAGTVNAIISTSVLEKQNDNDKSGVDHIALTHDSVIGAQGLLGHTSPPLSLLSLPADTTAIPALVMRRQQEHIELCLSNLRAQRRIWCVYGHLFASQKDFSHCMMPARTHRTTFLCDWRCRPDSLTQADSEVRQLPARDTGHSVQALQAALDDFRSTCHHLRPIRQRLQQKRQSLQQLLHHAASEEQAIADLQASLDLSPSMYALPCTLHLLCLHCHAHVRRLTRGSVGQWSASLG